MSAFKKQKTSNKNLDITENLQVVSTTSDMSILELNSWFLSKRVVGLGLVDFKYSGDECGGSLGCFAKEKIKVGDTIFIIPQTCIVGIGHAENTILSHFIRFSIAKHKLEYVVTSELLIWLFMLAERANKESDFNAYFSSLDTISPSLLNWNSSLLSAVEGTNLGTSTARAMESIKTHSEMLETLRNLEPLDSARLIPKHVFNLTSLIWARGHYLARRYPGTFAKKSTTPLLNVKDGREDGLENLGALVPLLDILNHNSDFDWLKLEIENNCLYVKCSHTVEKGAELFSNYGLLSNEKLLYAYGFAMETNPYDSIAVTLKAGVRRSHNSVTSSSTSSSSNQQSSESQSQSQSQCSSGGATNSEQQHQQQSKITNFGTFYIESGGLDGIPAELWAVLSKLGADDHGELKDITDEDLREPQVEVGLDECLLLRDYLEGKLRQFSGILERTKPILAEHGVEVEVEVDLPADHSSSSSSSDMAASESATATTATASTARDVNLRAVYIKYYLEGQLSILHETIAALSTLIEESTQDVSGSSDDDEEEVDEEEDN